MVADLKCVYYVTKGNLHHSVGQVINKRLVRATRRFGDVYASGLWSIWRLGDSLRSNRWRMKVIMNACRTDGAISASNNEWPCHKRSDNVGEEDAEVPAALASRGSQQLG